MGSQLAGPMLKSLRILEIRDFRRLWMGQAVSQFGDALYFLVLIFMTDRMTEDPTKVGLIAMMQAIPFLVFSPMAGAWADRFDRRKIMVASDLASILILLLLLAVVIQRSDVPFWVLLAASFALALVNVFFLPAKSAAIPRLVPENRLQEAMGLSTATQSLMPLIGIGFSSAVLAGLDRWMPNLFFLSAIVVNMVTFVVSASFLWRLPELRPERGEHHEEANTWGEAREGLRYAIRHGDVRGWIVLGFAMSLFISPFMLVYAAANRVWFGGEYWTLAAFEIGFVGTMVLGSLWVGSRVFRRPSLVAVGGMAVTGVLVALMGISPYFWPFLILNILCGISVPFNLPLSAHINATTPDAFRGRVNSLSAMVSQSALPLSNWLAGLGVAAFGVAPIFGIMGFGMAASAIACLGMREFRRIQVPVS